MIVRCFPLLRRWICKFYWFVVKFFISPHLFRVGAKKTISTWFCENEHMPNLLLVHAVETSKHVMRKQFLFFWFEYLNWVKKILKNHLPYDHIYIVFRRWWCTIGWSHCNIFQWFGIPVTSTKSRKKNNRLMAKRLSKS